MHEIEVELSWAEITHASHVGLMRQVMCSMRKARDRQPQSAPPSWDRDIVGAIAEYVAAKFLGLFWRAFGIGGTDVGPYQVRSKSEVGHRLCIKPQDRDDEAFILVQVLHRDKTRPRICGWYNCGDAKRPEWRSDDGFWYVPNDQLRPMAELPPPAPNLRLVA